MTCEFCGKSRMDVQFMEIKGVMKFAACIPCTRLVDDASRRVQEKSSKEMRDLLNKMIENCPPEKF